MAERSAKYGTPRCGLDSAKQSICVARRRWNISEREPMRPSRRRYHAVPSGQPGSAGSADGNCWATAYCNASELCVAMYFGSADAGASPTKICCNGSPGILPLRSRIALTPGISSPTVLAKSNHWPRLSYALTSWRTAADSAVEVGVRESTCGSAPRHRVTSSRRQIGVGFLGCGQHGKITGRPRKAARVTFRRRVPRSEGVGSDSPRSHWWARSYKQPHIFYVDSVHDVIML